MNSDKPITLIVTIYPPKKAQRKVLVSGASEGEMPVLMAGSFQERHALLDTVYAAVLKRDPQVVTIKDSASPKKATAKAGAPDEDSASEETSDETPATESGDQLAEDLPAIEGDEAGQVMPVMRPEAEAAFEAPLAEITADDDEVGNDG